MDQPLRWGEGTPQALTVIGGEQLGVAVDEDPDLRFIDVDHSVEAAFGFAEPPRVTAVEGMRFVVDVSGTDGGKFRVWYDVVVGGYPPEEFDFVWTRRGVLDAPAP